MAEVSFLISFTYLEVVMSRGLHVISSSGAYFSKGPDTELLKDMIDTQIAELKSEIKSGPWFWEKKDDELVKFKQDKIDGLKAINDMIVSFEAKKKTGKEVYDFIMDIDQTHPELCKGATSSCDGIVSSVKGHFMCFNKDPEIITSKTNTSPCVLI